MYDIIIGLDYGEEIKIPRIELIDLMQILPVISKMEFYNYGKQKDISIQLKPVKMVLCKDGKIIE